MTVRPSDLAARWGVHPSRITQLIKEGLPLDSVEAAEAWRDSRSPRAAGWAHKRAIESGAVPPPASGEPTPEAEAEVEPGKPDLTSDPGSLETLVEYQLRIVTVARNNLARAIRGNVGPQKVKAASDTLDKAVNTYAKLRREARAELVASRTLIQSTTAVERFRKVFALLIAEWERAEVEISPQANPANPGLALKVIRQRRIEIQKKVSGSAAAALQTLTGEDLGSITLPDDPETVEADGPIAPPEDDGDDDDPTLDDGEIAKG